MNKMILAALLMFFVGVVNAVKIDELNGMWLITSYQEMKGGEPVTADGTDFWEFKNSKYAVYASGFKFAETNYVLNGDKIIIKKSEGDQVVNIDSFEGETMQVNDGKYFYRLVKQ